MFSISKPAFQLLLRFPHFRWALTIAIVAITLVFAYGIFHYWPVRDLYLRVAEEHERALARYRTLKSEQKFIERVATHNQRIDDVYKKITLPYQSSTVVEQVGTLARGAGLTVRRERYSDIERQDDGAWQVVGRLALVGDYVSFANFLQSLDSISYMTLIERTEIKSEQDGLISAFVQLKVYGVSI